VWKSAFETWHPMVLAAYFAGTIGLAMFGIAPACVAISLAGGLSFALVTQGARAALAKLRWQLPLLVLICLINPLYSAMGSTLLGKVGPFRIYAESLAYGAVMGVLLVSVLLWFEAAASVVGSDEVLELGGGVLPSVTLATSMVMRLIPQLMRRGQVARDVAHASSASGKGPREGVRLLGVLLTWSLEDSVERSDSMRARGWGAHASRTAYRSHMLCRRDVCALLALAALFAASAWGVRQTLAGWQFYPRMHGTASVLVLAPYALLALLPTLAVMLDGLRWRAAS
jgi:energy-coupling factor transport system permease protein